MWFWLVFVWFLSFKCFEWAVRWRRFQPMLNHLLLTPFLGELCVEGGRDCFLFDLFPSHLLEWLQIVNNSKLTRPMLAGSSVPMPDELMELYNLYQQELHTRRAKDRIVEMKHIRKYCTQDLILRKESFVLLLQTLPLVEEILLPGKMRKRQTSYQSWTPC